MFVSWCAPASSMAVTAVCLKPLHDASALHAAQCEFAYPWQSCNSAPVACLPACRRKTGSQHGLRASSHMTKSMGLSLAGALWLSGQSQPTSERHTV